MIFGRAFSPTIVLFWSGVLMAQSESACFPHGTLDLQTGQAFVTRAEGAIAAINVRDAHVKWISAEAQVAVLAMTEIVVSADVRSRQLRFKFLDPKSGRTIVEVPPVPVSPDGYTNFQAHLEQGNLIIEWPASARYKGGAGPNRQTLQCSAVRRNNGLFSAQQTAES